MVKISINKNVKPQQVKKNLHPQKRLLLLKSVNWKLGQSRGPVSIRISLGHKTCRYKTRPVYYGSGRTDAYARNEGCITVLASCCFRLAPQCPVDVVLRRTQHLSRKTFNWTQQPESSSLKPIANCFYM